MHYRVPDSYFDPPEDDFFQCWECDAEIHPDDVRDADGKCPECGAYQHDGDYPDPDPFDGPVMDRDCDYWNRL